MDDLNKINLLEQISELKSIDDEKIKFLDNYFGDNSYIKSKCNIFNRKEDNSFSKNISLTEDQLLLLNELFKNTKGKQEKILEPKLNKEKLKLLMVYQDSDKIMKELLFIKNKINLIEDICDK